MEHGTESLRGKRVLISGGTTGIGRAIVEALVREGAHVATFARTAEDIEALRRDLPSVVAFVADAANATDMEAAVDRAMSEFGAIDVLVNNAGVSGDSVMDTPYEDWKSVLEINLLGPMLLTRLTAKRMRAGAHIVTIGSLSAKTRDGDGDVYVASKSGLRGFVDANAKGLAECGIVHTLIEPGLAESDMTTDDKSPEEVAKMKSEAKMMEAEDVARAVLFAAAQPPTMVISELQIRPRAQLI